MCCWSGTAGIGHVRYPTAGSLTAQEAQPFFVNSPLGIYLIHNGNLTNTDELREHLNGSQSFFSRHLRTDSDSEVIMPCFLRTRSLCRNSAMKHSDPYASASGRRSFGKGRLHKHWLPICHCKPKALQ